MEIHASENRARNPMFIRKIYIKYTRLGYLSILFAHDNNSRW